MYEEKLGKFLKHFEILAGKDEHEMTRKREMQELFQIMMALMSSMRSATIHPMIPNGREYTKRYSPSRRHLQRVEERPSSCVYCLSRNSSYTTENPRERVHGVNQTGFAMNEDEEARILEVLDENPFNSHDADDDAESLVPLPSIMCKARAEGLQHFAHKACMKILNSNHASCPRCTSMEGRIRFGLPECHPIYCKHILGGFSGSTKINSVVEWHKRIPSEEKVIILSFFRASLDLLEGIFVEDMGINCARFDGDCDGRPEVERFKKDPRCKVLLATVQSAGVGLNLTMANHVAFLDRWFNPFVHQQAEDRVYRIGQKRLTYISYFDCGATIDEAMAVLNEIKQRNSALILAEDVEIGNQNAGGLSYQDLQGHLSRLMGSIRSHRQEFLALESNENQPIPPFQAAK